jgi:hypothetical protein
MRETSIGWFTVTLRRGIRLNGTGASVPVDMLLALTPVLLVAAADCWAVAAGKAATRGVAAAAGASESAMMNE